MNNAHVQPSGEYHYHGIPEGYIDSIGGDGSSMTLIGWAADGFPNYARYGHEIFDDASSSLEIVEGSYQVVDTISDSRPSTEMYPLGTFAQDWEYVEGSGDLDECNGRVGITPEFPGGIYHYFATDSYPYMQRCVKGSVEAVGPTSPGPAGPPQGSAAPGATSAPETQSGPTGLSPTTGANASTRGLGVVALQTGRVTGDCNHEYVHEYVAALSVPADTSRAGNPRSSAGLISRLISWDVFGLSLEG